MSANLHATIALGTLALRRQIFCIQNRRNLFIVMPLDVFVGPHREFSATMPGNLSFSQ